MARYRVMSWKHIPAQVRAWDGEVEAKGMLPGRFQAAIDAYAMREGSTDMEAYLEGWRWGPVEERPGTPADVLAAVVAELDASYPRSRLLDPEP